MKLSTTLAAIALLATPAVAAAQGHGVAIGGGVHAALGRLAAPPPAALARGGVAQVGFRGGRFHGGDFRRRADHPTFVLLYPYWGWDCASAGDCAWDDDLTGLAPADEDGPPAPPPAAGYALADWAPPHLDANECSDWVWRARLHRSVCVEPFRG